MYETYQSNILVVCRNLQCQHFILGADIFTANILTCQSSTVVTYNPDGFHLVEAVPGLGIAHEASWEAE